MKLWTWYFQMTRSDVLLSKMGVLKVLAKEDVVKVLRFKNFIIFL